MRVSSAHELLRRGLVVIWYLQVILCHSVKVGHFLRAALSATGYSRRVNGRQQRGDKNCKHPTHCQVHELCYAWSMCHQLKSLCAREWMVFAESKQRGAQRDTDLEWATWRREYNQAAAWMLNLEYMPEWKECATWLDNSCAWWNSGWCIPPLRRCLAGWGEELPTQLHNKETNV